MLCLLRQKLSYSALLVVLAGCTTTAATGGGASGCGGGGLNENQKGPGDQPGGVQVGLGDIAVSPSGDYVIFKRGDELAVGWPATGRIEPLPITMPTRLAFSKTRPVVYVGSTVDDKVHAIDVEQRAELWSAWVTNAASEALMLASTADDGRLVATSYNRVLLFDAASGAEIGVVDAGRVTRDLEILPDAARALVVADHAWEDDLPSTRITVLDLEAGGSRTFDVPNCSDRIAVEKTGARAFLAPTSCQQDPISTIDLTPGDEHFVENLPGFGPVALAPDGVTAVGFLDGQNIDPTLFDDPTQIPELGPNDRYYLMVLDTGSLTYSFHAVGLALPRYAITPDGSVLLVDSGGLEPTRLFDTATKTFRAVQGPPIWLDDFVVTSDSTHAYVLHHEMVHETPGLFDLDIDAATSASVATPFLPLNINIAPDDRTLYLRETEAKICVFSLDEQRCLQHLATDAPSL